MCAALVSTIRDLGDMYKVLNCQRPPADLQQQVSVLERQLCKELKNLPPSTTSATVSTCRGAMSAAKHRPLAYSNSIAVPAPVGNANHSSGREHKKLDRSMSEPADKSSSGHHNSNHHHHNHQQPRPMQPNSSRYKTELCRPFEESGTCKYGDKCQFAHGVCELRTLARHPKYKTELCRTFHTTGLCPYGPRCHFIHNDFNRSSVCAVPSLPTGNINVPSPAGQLGFPNSVPVKELDVGSYSLGSAGDISPNSSSISGSPTSSNGLFLEDGIPALSPVPPSTPQTAPPVLTSNPAFFGRDFIPFSGPATSPVQQHSLPQQVPPPLVQQAMSAEQQRLASQIDVISSRLDNLNLASNSTSVLDSNRNIRLPVFNQLAFLGAN